jgi:hypothetical protein
VSATTGRVHAATVRVHATIGGVHEIIDQVPETVGRMPETIGIMREEIAAEYHTYLTLLEPNLIPRTCFVILNFHRCVLHVPSY